MASPRYGSHHRQTRKAWAPFVAAGIVRCWRCGELIRRGEAWDLGHNDEGTAHNGPEHAGRCNRSAGARKGNRLRRRPRPSRDW